MLDTLLKAIPLIVLCGGAVAWIVDKRTGWLSSAAQKAATERSENREALADEFTRLRSMNETLVGRIDKLVPDLEGLRQEYFEAVQREISLIDEIRVLRATSAANSLLIYQLSQAVREQNEYIEALRKQMMDAGMDVRPAPDLARLLAGIPNLVEILSSSKFKMGVESDADPEKPNV